MNGTMARLLAAFFVTFSVLLPAVWSFSVPEKRSGSGRIYGGHEIPIENAPWMAALWIPLADETTRFCGGSIIDERWILTAAHCFNNGEEPFSAWGYIGMHNLLDEAAQFIRATEKHCHESYAIGGQKNDICLLKLKNSIVFGEKVVKITLPAADYFLDAGTYVNVSGWGRTEFSAGAVENLRQVLVPLIFEETCLTNYPNLDSSLQICAGELGKDSCVGDSGGPLTFGNVQIGVVSYGRSCGNDRGGIYTKVTTYLDWISNTITANS